MARPYLICLPLLMVIVDPVWCQQTSCEEGPTALDDYLWAKLDTDPVKVQTGERSEWRAKLSCGKFQSRGNPPVSIIWTTPSGNILPSTSYDSGVFHLVPERVETGQYSCQINSTDPALACLDPNSALRLKVHVFVDGDVLLLQFLEAENAELQAINVQLKAAEVELEAECVEVDQRIVTSCQEAQSTGAHVLLNGTDPIPVFCDQDTAGGGWTVIQRRINGSLSFSRPWVDYEDGFWDLSGELWLGLRNVYRLTSSQKYSLRVDLWDWDGNAAYAEYRDFRISGPDDFYRLHISGYSGTAGDSLAKEQNNAQFSTIDQDHDNSADSCAVRGSWWYKNCTLSNLTGQYGGATAAYNVSLVWYAWKKNYHSLKHSEMKIRPQRMNDTGSVHIFLYM